MVVVKFRKLTISLFPLLFFFFYGALIYIDENIQVYLVNKPHLCGNVHPRQSLLDKNLSMGYNLSFTFVISSHHAVGYTAAPLNAGRGRMDWNSGARWICSATLPLTLPNAPGGAATTNFPTLTSYCEVLRTNWFVCWSIDRILWLSPEKIFVPRPLADLAKASMNADIPLKGRISFPVSAASCS